MAMPEHARRRDLTRAAAPLAEGPVSQAYAILRTGFTVAPIVAGLDKFFHLLAEWTDYLAPAIPSLLGVAPQTLMYAVGVIEIGAGLVVAARPRFGGWLVAVWLWGIIVNLLLVPGHYDIVLRDFGLSLGAIALARLAVRYEEPAGA